MGLRLISTQHQSLLWWRILLRETIGRIICIGTVFFGYIQILFKKDHRGLHDQIFGSMVVSDKKYQTSKAHSFAVVFAFILTFTFSFYYLFFKTPLIAKIAFFVLSENGVRISSLKGNLSEGWRVDSFQGGGNVVGYQAQGVHIQQAPVGFYSQGRWRAKEFSIEKLNFRVAPEIFSFTSTRPKFQNLQFNIESPWGMSYAFAQFSGMVEKIKIGDLSITDGKKLDLHFRNIEISQVKYENETLVIGVLSTQEKNSSLLSAQNIIFKPNEQYLSAKVNVTVKKDNYKNLKKDAKISIHWVGNLALPERIKVIALDNRINVDYQSANLALSVSGLTPANYFESSPIFTNFSARFKHTDCRKLSCLQSMDGRGSFNMNGRKIEFKNDVAWSETLGDNDLMQFNYNDLVSAFFTPQVVLKGVSEDTLQDFMAQLYFQKPYQELAVNEITTLKNDQIYFKVLKERFDPNKPKHRDTFLLRNPSNLQESK